MPRAERKPVAVGLLGGMNAATLWGKDVHDVDVRLWPVAGFSLGFNFPQFLGLETDLLYASRGSVFKSSELGPDTTHVHTFKVQTVTFPILFKITAPIAGEAKPIFFGGPSVAYFFSRSSSSEITYSDVGTGLIQTDPVTPDIPPENLQNFDVLLTLGGGLEWGLGSLQVRINLGQRSLDARNQKDIKTFTFEAMAGFIF